MEEFRNEDFSRDTALQDTIDALHAESCSCVILHRGERYVFRQRGVLDLYHLLEEQPELLRESFIADKVVGKAAAALMILGGVNAVYADVLSQPALALFADSQVRVGYGSLVPHIINRSQTGWCPLESRCYELKTPEECFDRIAAFVATLPASRTETDTDTPRKTGE